MKCIQRKGMRTLLTICSRLLLIDWKNFTRLLLRFAHVDISRMPNKVLKQFIGILLSDDTSCRLDDISGVLNEFPAFWGELVDVDGRGGSDVVERLVDLFVVRHTALTESFYYTIELNLHTVSRGKRIESK